MADIIYTYENTIYFNLTNACPMKCTFCIRNNGNNLGSATELWFKEYKPDFIEIKKAIDEYDFSNYTGEIVFCGYGEPTCALNNLIKSAKYLKEKFKFKIRLNTNGLCNLINKRNCIDELCSVIDSFSISLNEYNKEKYNKLCKPIYPDKAFNEMLNFASEIKKAKKEVKFSIVDVIPDEDIEQCKKLSDSLGIELRVRHYINGQE